ncbi:MAG: PD-(D/E)XK nuclease family protein [Akkermansiaceae bacterium]
MLQRIFVGYESPFLHALTDFLIEDRESLPETLVIVPTSQSGRSLRQALAERGKSILAPTVTTPGRLLSTDIHSVAPKWLETLAWIETLESLSNSDLKNFDGLFPATSEASFETPDWATSIAAEIVSLRTTLQNQRLDLSTASKRLAGTTEYPRWRDLARIESMTEKRLSGWNFTSRSKALLSDFQLPSHFNRIVLGGITELPSCLEETLREASLEIVSVIPAPDSEQYEFSEMGIPLDSWKERPLPDSASVSIHADPSTQAQSAVETIAHADFSSDSIALGSADEEVGAAICNLLSTEGWTAFFPAAKPAIPSLTRLLHVWKDWLSEASSRNLASLLTLPESDALISGNRATNSQLLNKTRDRFPIVDPESLARILDKKDDSDVKHLQVTISNLLKARSRFLSTSFPKAIDDLLSAIESSDGNRSETASQVRDFLDEASPIFGKVKRSHSFWLQMLLKELPTPTSQPPEDRVIDIQGWLELLFEPGKELIICGMNDRFVPARSGGEPWLSETIRVKLGIATDSDRHSRDAFLLHAMIKMRESSGSTNLLCGQNSLGGDSYLPSRLLLEVERKKLVPTVKNLFREIEPPEANLIWTRDWKWQTPSKETPKTLSVTALRDYLSCPFRFYMKHIVKVSQPEPDRREMNARDFGSVTHEVLEFWGKDPEAKDLDDAAALASYFDSILARSIFRKFGKKPPLSIRIQAKSIRQRLEWFAIEQAEMAKQGWQIIHIERKINIEAGAFTIRGMIDRVDQHRETGQLRVIDYKTGKVNKVESEHRQQVSARTRIPSHVLGQVGPLQDGVNAKGKPVQFLWKNLQLPLYSLAERTDHSSENIPIPCYIGLGKTKGDIKLSVWDQFSNEDLDAAKSCMEWIASQIDEPTFWPPSEKVAYDDFAVLAHDSPFPEAFTKP